MSAYWARAEALGFMGAIVSDTLVGMGQAAVAGGWQGFRSFVASCASVEKLVDSC